MALKYGHGHVPTQNGTCGSELPREPYSVKQFSCSRG